MTLAQQNNGESDMLVNLIQRAATDDTFSLDKLDRLLDVKERWEKEEARKAYVAALAGFKANPPQIVKSQTVDFSTNKGRTHYKYASLGQVAADVAIGLAPHGLSHSWDVAQDKDQVIVTCILTHMRGHSERVSIAGPKDDTGNKNGIQQVGSTIAYLQRYTLMAITGLAAHDQDDDGESATPQRREPPPRQPTEPEPRAETYDPWAEWAAGVEAATPMEFDEVLASIANDPRPKKVALAKQARSLGIGIDPETLVFFWQVPPEQVPMFEEGEPAEQPTMIDTYATEH